MPGKGDKWWSFKPRTDLDQLGEEVHDAINCHALPWLETYSNPLSALDYTVQNGLLIPASLLALKYESVDYARSLIDQCDKKLGGQMRTWILEIGSKNGVKP